MTFNIPHHGFNHLIDEMTLEDREKNTKYWAAAIESNPYNTDLALSTIHLAALFSTASDPDAAYPDTWESWVTSMQFHHAFFMMSRNTPETDMQFLVYGKNRRTHGIGPNYAANASNWIAAFFLTSICRDEERRNELCEIPIEFIKECGESEGTEYAPFSYHWISALQALILNRSELGEELLAAMELTDPSQVDFGDPEAVDMLTFPLMNAFLRLVEGDKVKFNEALADGLNFFRSYHLRDEENFNNIEGVVPLGLLALACIAHDISYHNPDFFLEVESGYLPKFLVNGAWHGNMPI